MGKEPIDETEAHRIRHLTRIFRAKGRELQAHVQTPVATYVWVDVPPVPLRSQITKDLHVSLGHVGRDKLLESLRDWYWWPGMHNDVARCLEGCLACRKDAPYRDTWVQP